MSFSILSNLTGAPVFAAISFMVLIMLHASEITLIETIILSIVVILFSFLVPVTYIINFAKLKGKEYDIPEKGDRTKPFLVAIISYVSGVIALFLVNAPSLIKILMMCYAMNTFFMMIITRYWKISVHTAGVTGPLTVLIYKLGLVFLPLYLIAVPVGWIRVKLTRHSYLQVCAGAVFMIIMTWTQIVLYTPYI